MIQIQLQPEIEAQLIAEAHACGMALEQYILEKLAGSSRAWPAEQGSIADAIDRIRELRKGNTLGGLSTTDLVREGRKY